MSKARDLADFQGSASALTTGTLPVDRVPYVGRRNLIINGAMQVWQRGTTQTTSQNNSYHCVDRWIPYSSGRTQYEQSTDTPDGFVYSLATSGSPSGEYIISYAIELDAVGNAGQFFVGQTFTVSYYAKSSVAGDVLMDWMAFRDANVSSSNQVEAKTNDGSQTHTLTTSWKRYSRTYSITGTPNSTNKCLTLAIRNHWDNDVASGNIKITGVQLELGSVATPFEHRSYGEELALCQRYYEAGAVFSHVASSMGSGGYYSGGQQFSVTKRVQPSIILYDGYGVSGTLSNRNGIGTNYAVSSNTWGVPTGTGFAIRAESSIPDGTPLHGYYHADAEL